MSVPAIARTNNRESLRANWATGTGVVQAVVRWGVFIVAIAATLTISVADSRVAWGLDFGALAIGAAAVWVVRGLRTSVAISLAAIALWGFAQLALHGTVYGYRTLDRALGFAALTAMAIAGSAAFADRVGREQLIRALAWLGFAIAATGVIAHAIAQSGDSWGWFVSRNKFAQFLELALPAAMWRARSGSLGAIAIAASILAAGLASASRAGAILLAAETVICLILLRGSRWKFGIIAALAISIAGVSQLRSRFDATDPLEYRREFAHSAIAMIRDRPLAGFGIGTFADVYPAYAVFDPGKIVDHAHNDWLEWTAEGGLGFGASWLALAVAIAPAAVRSIWGMGVVAVFLHAAVDYPFARAGIAMWVFVLIGALAVWSIAGENNRWRDALN